MRKHIDYCMNLKLNKKAKVTMFIVISIVYMVGLGLYSIGIYSP